MGKGREGTVSRAGIGGARPAVPHHPGKLESATDLAREKWGNDGREVRGGTDRSIQVSWREYVSRQA